LIGRPDEAKLTADEAFRIAQASGDAWMIAMAAWARALAAGSATLQRSARALNDPPHLDAEMFALQWASRAADVVSGGT